VVVINLGRVAESLLGVPYKKGDVIGGKYRIHDTLGKGGFGIVYLVDSTNLGILCALKTFRDEYLEDAKARERFRKEAEVWMHLDPYDYLVRAYTVDEVNGRLYIALEYVAPNDLGLNSLEGYLRHRPPDLVQSLRWAGQFCSGMLYAYSRGIRCHRDIKPANIMIYNDATLEVTARKMITNLARASSLQYSSG
jgi:serine/threonine protein kinase